MVKNFRTGGKENMKHINKIINEIEDLTPIPQVTHKIITLLKGSDTNISTLTEVLLYDPAITSNILKICNSAYFGLPRKIDSLQQAITYLGINQIIDIVLMKSTGENLKKEQKGYELHEGELWKYSVASALIAKELNKKLGKPLDHLIFTAALLKDIGKVVLNKYVANAYENINNLVLNERLSFREAESRIIGIDHSELGGLVAEKWNFSPKMVYIIRNHHLTDQKTRDDFETCIVYLADTLCMMSGIGVGADCLAYKLDKDIIKSFNLTEKELQEIMIDIVGKVHKIETMIDIV